jgi:hypothetical protein
MTQRGRERDASKEHLWRDAIRRWQRSGQTIREFCREQRLKEGSFHSWRRTIAWRDHPAASASATPRQHQPTFVPLRVTPTPTAAAAAVPLELVLDSGRIVRVSPGFDAATLQTLLAVLEEQPSC